MLKGNWIELQTVCGRYTVLIDEADFHLVEGARLYAIPSPTTEELVHVRIYCRRRGITKMRYLHQHLCPQWSTIDHENNNGLDNRRSNLREATPQQNSFNRRKRKGRTSRFIGVSFNKASAKWEAHITINAFKTHLGYFGDEEEAARARDAAARKYHGKFAKLNFTDDGGSK